jgi:hypothetical protein
MTTTPLPLTAPPHGTVQPPNPRGSEDHETHLSGGARYASAYRMQSGRSLGHMHSIDRARSWRIGHRKSWWSW